MKPVKAWMIVDKIDGNIDLEHLNRTFHWFKEDAKNELEEMYNEDYWHVVPVLITEVKSRKK